MNITLKGLKDIKSETCVTIVLNTHRIMPDNQMGYGGDVVFLSEGENNPLISGGWGTATAI